MEERNALNINEIDSSLSYEDTFPESRLDVFKVCNGKSNYVLKIVCKDYYWNTGHIVREGEVLEFARNVPGITHLIKKYASNDLHNGAILKEYFDGNELLLRDARGSIGDIINDTVYDLHSLGIVNLDLAYRNIVVSPDKQDAKIIDLDSCDVYSRNWKTITYDDFMEKRKMDLNALRHIFR